MHTTHKSFKMENDHPAFSFNGPRYNYVTKNGRWYHATGMTQVGMTGSIFNGEIWYIDLNETIIKWFKAPLVIPKMDVDFMRIDENDFIFIADKNEGVFKGEIASS